MSSPHIVIMDSSYNPPHLAHLAMASSSLPPPGRIRLNSPAVTDKHAGQSSESPYTARLLVFSVRNIEKSPKAGDASVIQRLEMTILLAKHLASVAPLPGGVAVGVLNEPTFVGKSRIVHRFLTRHNLGLELDTPFRPKLSFLIGSDTLTRFFVARFYPAGMDQALHEFFDVEGSMIVCGRRGTGQGARDVERAELERDEVRPWVEKGCVRMLGSGEEGFEEVSSTRIRTAVKSRDWETLEQLVPMEIVAYIRREGLYRE